jgi:uncharacterized membrane protein
VNELIEFLRAGLDRIGELTEIILNALSLVSIVAGVIIALIRSIQARLRSPGLHPLHTNFRMLFGGWLVVALEFQLAADIAGTIVSPSTQHLVELGAIAFIRTFLNYFLSKELKEEKELSPTTDRDRKKEQLVELH